MTVWLVLGLVALLLAYVGWRKMLTRPGLDKRIRSAMDGGFTDMMRKRCNPDDVLVFDFLFTCDTAEVSAALVPLIASLGYQVQVDREADGAELLTASISKAVSQMDFSQARQSFATLTMPFGTEYAGLGALSYAAAGVKVP